MKTGLIMTAAWLAMASTPLAAAQLYQWKDADGRTVFSDQPPPTPVKNVQQRNFRDSVIETGEPYALLTARAKFPVTLYISACGPLCDQARQLLDERGIPYRNKDLIASEDARKELQKLTGKLNVPVLMVGSEQIEGFQAGQWHAALDRAGYPKTAMPSRPPMPVLAPAPQPKVAPEAKPAP
jgi:glutaredoxin